jgi:DNA-binding transcriptional regulator/RsmH inhibitor MraZ
MKSVDIEFEELEKQYIEQKKEDLKNEKIAENTIIEKATSIKWDSDTKILYTIYLIQNNFLKQDDIRIV